MKIRRKTAESSLRTLASIFLTVHHIFINPTLRASTVMRHDCFVLFDGDLEVRGVVVIWYLEVARPNPRSRKS